MAYTLKTRPDAKSVAAFIGSLDLEARRRDCTALRDMMERVTGLPPVMWGDAIVGFGRYHYVYRSGHRGEWFLTGFAPRSRALTVYIMPGFDLLADLMTGLGPHKTAKSCLYLKQLADIDSGVLEKIVARSVAIMRTRYRVDGA